MSAGTPIKNRPGLTKKKITDSRGRTRNVWVRLEKFKEKEKRVYSDEKNRATRRREEREKSELKTTGQKVAYALKQKRKGFMIGLKREVKEWKEAGHALKKLSSGQKITDHEKHALLSVCVHAGIVVAMAVPPLAAKMAAGASAGKVAMVAGKKLGLGFAKHTLLFRGGHAGIFAKAETTEGGVKDAISDKEAEEMIMSFYDFLIEKVGKEGTNKK